jgi:hypothetical protein
MTLFIRKALLAGTAALAVTLFAATPGDARDSGHLTTYLTFNREVGLPGVTLAPGTYIFELAAPTASVDAVQVKTGDGRRLVYLGFTTLVTRPRGLKEGSSVALGEAVEGAPRPIAVWFPPDTSEGRRFLYSR